MYAIITIRIQHIICQHRSTRNLQLSATDAEPLLPNNDPDVEMIPRRRPPIVRKLITSNKFIIQLIPFSRSNCPIDSPEPDTENEEDDDDGDRRNQPRLPNTPDAHPGVDPSFFPTTEVAGRPDYDSNGNDLDGDDIDGPKIGSRSGGGNQPPSRRPSFPFVPPGIDGTVVSGMQNHELLNMTHRNANCPTSAGYLYARRERLSAKENAGPGHDGPGIAVGERESITLCDRIVVTASVLFSQPDIHIDIDTFTG